MCLYKNLGKLCFAHQFGLNSFLGTQLSVIQNMSTVGQKNILSMHSPLFINSFPELPLQPPMSAAIFLSMSLREVMLLASHVSNHLPLHVTTGSYAFKHPWLSYLYEPISSWTTSRFLGGEDYMLQVPSYAWIWVSWWEGKNPGWFLIEMGNI